MVRSLVAPLSVLALIVTAGCATPPADLDVSLKQVTADGKFVVTLQPPAAPPAINQMHAWQVRVSTAAGVPVAARALPSMAACRSTAMDCPRGRRSRRRADRGRLPDRRHEVQHDRLVGNQARHPDARRRRQRDLQHRVAEAVDEPLNATQRRADRGDDAADPVWHRPDAAVRRARPLRCACRPTPQEPQGTGGPPRNGRAGIAAPEPVAPGCRRTRRTPSRACLPLSRSASASSTTPASAATRRCRAPAATRPTGSSRTACRSRRAWAPARAGRCPSSARATAPGCSGTAARTACGHRRSGRWKTPSSMAATGHAYAQLIRARTTSRSTRPCSAPCRDLRRAAERRRSRWARAAEQAAWLAMRLQPTRDAVSRVFAEHRQGHRGLREDDRAMARRASTATPKRRSTATRARRRC